MPLADVILYDRWPADDVAPAPPPSRLRAPEQRAVVHARDVADRLLTPPGSLGVLDRAPAQGGMPDRVKCLHVLVAHSLAVGPGVNPFGDEALDLLPEWGAAGPCVDPDS